MALGGIAAGALVFAVAPSREAGATRGESAPDLARDDPWRKLTSSLETPAESKAVTEQAPSQSRIAPPLARYERGAPMPAVLDTTSFQEWLAAARAGDGTAARWVHDALRSCERLPQSAEELEKSANSRVNLALSFVKEIRAQAIAKGEKVPDIPLPNTEEIVNDEMRAELDRARRCEGIPRATPDEILQWLERAADLGDPDARLRYGMEAIHAKAWLAPPSELPPIKRRLLTHLRDSLAEHDPRALQAIAEVFDKGIFAEPSPAEAYAYYHAFTRAHVPDEAMPWLRRTFFQPPPNRWVKVRMGALAEKLTPEQLAAARAKGERLYASCCS